MTTPNDRDRALAREIVKLLHDEAEWQVPCEGCGSSMYLRDELAAPIVAQALADERERAAKKLDEMADRQSSEAEKCETGAVAAMFRMGAACLRDAARSIRHGDAREG